MVALWWRTKKSLRVFVENNFAMNNFQFFTRMQIIAMNMNNGSNTISLEAVIKSILVWITWIFKTPLVHHLKCDSSYEIVSKFDCEPLDAHTSLFSLLHFASTFKRMPNYEQIEENLITVNPFGVAPLHHFGIVVTFLSILSAQTVK